MYIKTGFMISAYNSNNFQRNKDINTPLKFWDDIEPK